MLKSLTSARAATADGRQDDGSELRLAQARQPVRCEKIKIGASRQLTSSPDKAVKELLND
jgi:hypothetical protein